MDKFRLIRLVLENSKNGQKIVTIPKNTNLEKGDYVEIIKVPELKNKKVNDDRE
jgi:hypothetical protein